MTDPTAMTLDPANVEKLLKPALRVRDVDPEYALLLTTADAPTPSDPHAVGHAWCVFALPRKQVVRVYSAHLTGEDIETISADRSLDEIVALLDFDDHVVVRVMSTGAEAM